MSAQLGQQTAQPGRQLAPTPLDLTVVLAMRATVELGWFALVSYFYFIFYFILFFSKTRKTSFLAAVVVWCRHK